MEIIISVIGISLNTILSIISIIISVKVKAENKKLNTRIEKLESAVTISSGAQVSGFSNCSDVKDCKANITIGNNH